MTWTSYEEGLHGCWTLSELQRLYENTVDRGEYPSFSGWLWDMERSAVLYRHEG